jgi:predicted Zn-ribbon and HTH transcriptional regulator
MDSRVRIGSMHIADNALSSKERHILMLPHACRTCGISYRIASLLHYSTTHTHTLPTQLYAIYIW